MGRCLDEVLGQEVQVRVQVLEHGPQQAHFCSLRWVQQKMISVGMKLGSPTYAHLPQIPLQ